MKDSKDYQNFDRKENLKLASKVVHGALGVDPVTGSISFPIYQTATFKHSGIEKKDPYNYARCINPTREELEKNNDNFRGRNKSICCKFWYGSNYTSIFTT